MLLRRSIAQKEDIKETIESSYGIKYVIEGIIQSPNGSTIKIKTVWIIEKGETAPRLVTAYPI